MLTYESLLEHAKLREMPLTKLRGILREYLQILMLKEIYKRMEGKKLFFTGGTSLRLVYNLKRFSEDLDFDTNSLSKKDFEELLTRVQKELERIGFTSNISFDFWNNVYSSKLYFLDIEKKYFVSSSYVKKPGIVIKIECNKTKYKLKGESVMITGFGEFFPVLCTDKGITFANKIDALLKKERARHLYDFMFMLSNKYPLDKKLMKNLGIKGDPFETVLKKIKSFTSSELKKKAESFKPFLFDESEAEKIAQAHELVPMLVERYGRN